MRASGATGAEPVLDPVQFDAVELRRHLVKRAARASGIEELVQKLGREIESEEERRQFMKACQQAERAAVRQRGCLRFLHLVSRALGPREPMHRRGHFPR